MGSTFRIVVGLDGSTASAHALRWAMREAVARNGGVAALTAFEFTAMDGSSLRYRADQRHLAERRLATLLSKVRAEYPQVPLTGRVVVGPAAELLATESACADLLVLGSHRPGRLAEEVFGSVAAACLRTALCPVLVIPEATPPRTVAEPAEMLATGVPVGLL